jgi:hypothetical protein
VKIFKNFAEKATLKIEYSIEGMHGGALIGVRGTDFVVFYDWSDGRLVRRIDVPGVKDVIWSDNGQLVAILGENSFYILQYNRYVATRAARLMCTCKKSVSRNGMLLPCVMLLGTMTVLVHRVACQQKGLPVTHFKRSLAELGRVKKAFGGMGAGGQSGRYTTLSMYVSCCGCLFWIYYWISTFYQCKHYLGIPLHWI